MGHDFSFAELDDTQYHWELDAPTVRPMLVNGTLTMLIKVDAKHPVPSGATTYTIDGSTYYVDSSTTGLTATNIRRSYLDVVKTVTGANAPADAEFDFTMKVVNSLPKDEKIVFGPDRNLGNYINSVTGRQMVLWNGACHVHEKFSLERILELKAAHPDAKILVHPECKGPIVKVADKVGSTAALLKFSQEDSATEFIVATESGILHKMQQACPQKVFLPAPPNDSTCACNECNFMKLITMEKLYNCLKYEWPEIEVEQQVAEKAVKCINRMLELSAQ